MSDTSEILLRSHEERLQSLDSDLQDNTRETVQIHGQIDALGSQMSAGFDRIAEKMQYNADVTTQMNSKIDVIARQVGVHDAALQKFKVEDKVLSARNKKLKAAGIGLFLTSAGAVMKHLGDQIWATLYHH